MTSGHFVLCFLILSVCLVAMTTAQGNLKTKKRSDMLGSLLLNLQGQSNKVPPTYNSDLPTVVQCQVYVDSFDSVSEASMDYTVSIMLALSWYQPRLKYLYNVEFFEIDSENMKKLWVPDLYFPNEKLASFHQIMGPNTMMRLYPDGRLEYLARLSLTLSCPMNLRNYPFDRQSCSLKIESFGFDSEKLILEWVTDGDPVEINEDIELPQFQVVAKESGVCSKQERYKIGNHSCLMATFHLERSLQYYLIQMYIPSSLIVVVSWLSFWLTASSVPGRISLGVLTVLTMTTQSSSVNASLPRVSYIKAIDLWMSTCLVFVFAALIEFAVVNVLSRRRRAVIPPPAVHITSFENCPGPSSEATCAISNSSPKMDSEKGRPFKESIVDLDGRTLLMGDQDEVTPFERPCCDKVALSTFLDKLSRVVFPFCFAIFGTCYWTYYCHLTDTALSVDTGANETELIL